MTGGGGDRRSPPVLRGGGARLSSVGRFEDVKGLVDCCSPGVSRGGAEVGAGMEVDSFVPCMDGMEEDGWVDSSDSEELEGSRVAEEVSHVEVGAADSVVCMAVMDVVHGEDRVGLPVGAEVLLQKKSGGAGELLQGISLLHGVNPGMDLGGSDCLEAVGAHQGGGSLLGVGADGVLAAGRTGLPRVGSGMQGVRGLATEKIYSQDGGCSAPVNSASSPRPVRAAWNRPAVIPLPVVVPSSEVRDGAVRVRLELDEVDATMRLLEFALVGRMFGRRIPFAFLNAELHRRWQRFGPFRIITVSGDCFICIFDAAESRDAVLMGGPWIVAGQVLGIDCWSPGFSPSSKVGSVTPVWVCLPGLPMYCWGGKSLARIAGGLGEPIWMDAATDRMERGLFARVCIRVDLSMALKPGVWVDGPYGSFFQHVEYEGLSSFCFLCGRVGHKALGCKEGGARPGGPVVDKGKDPCVGSGVPADCGEPSGARREHVGMGVEGVELPDVVDVVKDGEEDGVDMGFGPWMLVQRRKRQNNVGKRGAAKGRGSASSGLGGKSGAGKRQALVRASGHGGGASSPVVTASTAWVQKGWPGGKDGWVVSKGAGSGDPSSFGFGESQVDLGKVGLKPFSGFKARCEVASLGPIIAEDRRKRKKSSIDGGEVSPLVGQ